MKKANSQEFAFLFLINLDLVSSLPSRVVILEEVQPRFYRYNLLRPSLHSEILRGGVFLVVILERSEESREKHLARG